MRTNTPSVKAALDEARGKTILSAIEKYAPEAYDPITDDMTVPFAIQLAEKDAEIVRLKEEIGRLRGNLVES